MNTITIQSEYALGERLYHKESGKAVIVEAITKNLVDGVMLSLRYCHNGYVHQWNHSLIADSFEKKDPDEEAYMKWFMQPTPNGGKTFRDAWFDGLRHGRKS